MKDKQGRLTKNPCDDFIDEFSQLRSKYEQWHSLEVSTVEAITNLTPCSFDDFVIECLKECSLPPPSYEVALGYSYIRRGLMKKTIPTAKGEREFSIGISWPVDDLRVAVRHLNNALKQSRDNALFLLLLEICFLIIVDLEKYEDTGKRFVEAFNKQRLEDKKAVEALEKMLEPYKYMRLTELYIAGDLKDMFDCLTKELEHVVEKAPMNQIAIVLLFHLYTKQSNLEKCFEVLKNWAENVSSPIAYEALGRQHLERREYGTASECFRKAMASYQDISRRNICTILHEYSSGLHSWFVHDSTGRNSLSEATKHFYKCAKLVAEFKVDSFNDLRRLPSILELCHQSLGIFASSRNLHELSNKVEFHYSALLRTVNWERLQANMNYPEITGNPTTVLIIVMHSYLSYLGVVLKIPIIQKNISKVAKEMKITEGGYLDNCLSILRRLSDESREFYPGKSLLNILKLFEHEVRNRSIEDISEEQGAVMLKRMAPLFAEVARRGNSAVLNQSIGIGKVNIYVDRPSRVGKHDAEEAIRVRTRKTSSVAKERITVAKRGIEGEDKRHKRNKVGQLKPFKPKDEKFIGIEKITVQESQNFEKEMESLFNVKASEIPGLSEVFWSSWLIQTIRRNKDKIKSDIRLRFKGESGTGKSFCAEIFHKLSNRRNFRLVRLNCADFIKREQFLESELFGHVVGAFTDARTTKLGLLKVADRSSFCMENIENLPIDVQAKLLVFLEQGEFRKKGGTEIEKSDVRLFTTYVKDIETLVNKGEFSDQLYGRIKGALIDVPPLYEREDEIAGLIRLFTIRYSQKYSKNIQMSKKIIDFARTFSWPKYNIRSLDNAIENAVVDSTDEKIYLSSFLSTLNAEMEIDEIWEIYGRKCRDLREGYKGILSMGFGTIVNAAKITKKFGGTREMARVWLTDLANKGFIKKLHAKKGQLCNYQIRYPFEV